MYPICFDAYLLLGGAHYAYFRFNVFGCKVTKKMNINNIF